MEQLTAIPFIEPISEEDASATLADFYESDRAEDGYVANVTRAFSHRPEVLAAWATLITTVRESMDRRRYELATLAAARRLRSTYCMLGHGTVLAERFFDPATTAAIVRDHRDAGLDDVDVAVMDLAEKVAGDATAVTEVDIERLRGHGLSDQEIFDVVAAAAARAFLTKVLDGLGFLADSAYRELDPELLEALVVGRPVAER